MKLSKFFCFSASKHSTNCPQCKQSREHAAFSDTTFAHILTAIVTMDTKAVLQFLTFLCLLSLVRCQVQDSCDLCINNSVYKSKPEREQGGLYGRCAVYEDRSCCTNETAYKLHLDGFGALYNVNHDVCPGHDMSAKCRERFLENDCFFHCSPNMGPWIGNGSSGVNTKASFMPIKPQVCDAWYNDCKDDYTCTDNWASGWNWTTGTNTCKVGSTCRKFSEFFPNATSMCENVYPEDYVVVTASEPGMVFWFDSPSNPNDQVAKDYAEENGLRCDVNRSRCNDWLMLWTFSVLLFLQL